MKVVACYLLSNLETPNFGCFIDSAGILDYVFRKLDSILYTWRTCFQWKTAVEKKKIESNVIVDMGTVPFTESVFFLFLTAIQKCLQKSLEKTSNVADFSKNKPADDTHNLLNIWLFRGMYFCFNTLCTPWLWVRSLWAWTRVHGNLGAIERWNQLPVKCKPLCSINTKHSLTWVLHRQIWGGFLNFSWHDRVSWAILLHTP